MTTTTTKTRFSLTSPCKNYPFRSDVAPYLRPERAQSIAQGLREGAYFTCHKTTVSAEEDEDGCSEMVDGPNARECAGALITMAKEGIEPNHVRIAARLGLYDESRLNMDAPVYDSLTEWVRSYEPVPTVTPPNGEVLEYEHCGVVGPGCEDPAGYMTGSGASENYETPTCDPTVTCVSCGNTMCDTCRAEDGEDGPMCVYCAEDNEE